MGKWNTDSCFEFIFHHFLSPRPDHSKIGEGWCATKARSMRQFLSNEQQLCCTDDEGRPFGIAIQVEIPNRLKLLWTKATVVSVKEKTRLDLVRYVLRRRINEPLITCRNPIGCHQNQGAPLPWDKSGRNLFTDQMVTGIKVA